MGGDGGGEVGCCLVTKQVSLPSSARYFLAVVVAAAAFVVLCPNNDRQGRKRRQLALPMGAKALRNRHLQILLFLVLRTPPLLALLPLRGALHHPQWLLLLLLVPPQALTEQRRQGGRQTEGEKEKKSCYHQLCRCVAQRFQWHRFRLDCQQPAGDCAALHRYCCYEGAATPQYRRWRCEQKLRWPS